MLEENPYPKEIREEWRRVAASAGLCQEKTKELMKVVDYTQTPLSIKALSRAYETYNFDHDHQCDASTIDHLNSLANISKSLPRMLGSHYPVYYAMTHPRHLGKLDDPMAQSGRHLLSQLFKNSATGRMVSRFQFYRHAVNARDVMTSVIRSEWQSEEKELPSEEYFRDAIRSDEMFAKKEALRDKISIFEALLSGTLEPGGKLREGHGGNRATTRARGRRFDKWHDDILTKLATRTRLSTAATKTLTDVPSNSESEGSASELQSLGVQLRPASRGLKKDEEASESVTLQRTTPSTQTPGDDRQLARHWMANAPTSSVKNTADLSRLTPEQVEQILTTQLTPDCRLYAALLITTGLPPKRLARLELNSDDNDLESAVANITGAHPLWLTKKNLLCYRLLNGPSAIDGYSTTQWVILRLPEEMARLMDIRLQTVPEGRPFRLIREKFNNQLRKHFSGTPGITPSANRLSAASWLHIRPHARDDVAAATLSGQFDLDIAAPAAYRALSREEIQRVFDRTLVSLGWEITPATSSPTAAGLATSPAVESMGSAIAQPSQIFVTIFRQLRTAMIKPAAELSCWYSEQPAPVASLTTIYQLAAAHELLAWQLSSGARPVGPGAQCRLGDGLQWLHDKHSGKGKESRVIPLLMDIRKSLHSLHHWAHLITERLSHHEIHIDDQRSGKCQTPGWMQVASRGRRIIIRDMYWRDLRAISCIDVSNWPNNVARHSTASWLRHVLPDAEVDNLLGHARNGRCLSSPRAEAALGQQQRLRSALTEWLDRCGYKHLEWESMPWFH